MLILRQKSFKPLVNSPGSDNIGKLEISFYLFVATGVWNSRAILKSIKPFGIAICKTMSTTTVQITLQIIPFGFYTSIILVLKNGGIIVSVRLFSFYFGGSKLVRFFTNIESMRQENWCILWIDIMPGSQSLPNHLNLSKIEFYYKIFALFMSYSK